MLVVGVYGLLEAHNPWIILIVNIAFDEAPVQLYDLRQRQPFAFRIVQPSDRLYKLDYVSRSEMIDMAVKRTIRVS